MICPLEGGKAINFTETSLPHLFAEQSLVWFRSAVKISPMLLDSILDDPQLPKITISHLQLIRYCHHASNKQAVRLLQCLAPKWRKVGGILGLHRAVIQTIENPGSGRDPEDCIRQVFMKWLDDAPQMPNHRQYPLTWRGLHNLLLDSDNAEAAGELKVALSSQFNTVQGTYKAAGTEQSNQPHSSTIPGEGATLELLSTSMQRNSATNIAVSEFQLNESYEHTDWPHATSTAENRQPSETLLVLRKKEATHTQGQTSQSHPIDVPGESTTLGTLPILKAKQTLNIAASIPVSESQMTISPEQTDQPTKKRKLQQPSEILPVVVKKQKIGAIHPEFCQSMSFEEFTDLLKQRGVMEKDIDLLTSESINAKAFVMLEEEELKELGVSFGGRMILRNLMKELK